MAETQLSKLLESGTGFWSLIETESGTRAIPFITDRVVMVRRGDLQKWFSSSEVDRTMFPGSEYGADSIQVRIRPVWDDHKQQFTLAFATPDGTKEQQAHTGRLVTNRSIMAIPYTLSIDKGKDFVEGTIVHADYFPYSRRDIKQQDLAYVDDVVLIGEDEDGYEAVETMNSAHEVELYKDALDGRERLQKLLGDLTWEWSSDGQRMTPLRVIWDRINGLTILPRNDLRVIVLPPEFFVRERYRRNLPGFEIPVIYSEIRIDDDPEAPIGSTVEVEQEGIIGERRDHW